MKNVLTIKKLVIFSAMFLLLFSLTACSFTATMGSSYDDEFYNEESEVISFSDITPDGNYQIIYGPDGTEIHIPILSDDDSELDSETEQIPSKETVRLPNGTLADVEDVIYLEDGTIVVKHEIESEGYSEHYSFLPDGTKVNTSYMDDDYNQVNFSESTTIYAHYYTADNRTLKEEYIYTEGMKVFSLTEWIYSELEIGSPDSPLYLSEKITYYYDNPYSSKTVYEFDPLHGEEKYHRVTSYDLNNNVTDIYDYKYALSGMLEKVTGSYPNGKIFYTKTYYENGNSEHEILIFDDGSIDETFYDEQGLTTLCINKYSHGTTHRTSFTNGIKYLTETTYNDGSITLTHYDDNGVETRAENYSNGILVSYTTYEINQAPVYSKNCTYTANHILTEVIEYLTNGYYWEHEITTTYYTNGNVHEIYEYREEALVRHEEYDINGVKISN